MYQATYDASKNFLRLDGRDSGKLMELPLDVRFSYNGKDTYFTDKKTVAHESNCITVSEADEEIACKELKLTLLEDSVLVEFRVQAATDVAVYETELFRQGSLGIKMIDCLNCFAPQPFNFDGINRAFNKYFCDCSMNGYFTPAPLNFSVGNRHGWVSFGLLDLPDSYEYRMTRRLGVLVEKPWGHIKLAAGQWYTAPRLLITFPEDEYQGIRLYRQKLEEFGIIPANKPKRQIPQWWKRPLVVTYGDEMMELQHNWFNDDDLDGPDFNEEWLYMWLDRAEKKLQNTEFTVLVDALWQYRYTPEAYPDATRFPNFRGFIDHCHSRGHKVVLWAAPLICNDDLPVDALAVKYDMLAAESLEGWPHTRKIDFTSDNAPAYMAELCEKFFSDAPGCLNADGLKLDFLAALQNPETTATFRNPANGLGVKEMYRMQKLMYEAAVKVKPDVLLDASTCDPRFEDIVSMNRLHDIQKVPEEREMRARVSSLACPDLPIDSDGAIMISPWVKSAYISAILYATPALYYIKEFHDSIALPAEEMAALGRLLSISEKKQQGEAVFLSQGNWCLMDGESIQGASFNGETVLIFGDDHKAYLFSWKDGDLAVPFFGRRTAAEGFTVEQDMLIGKVRAGQIYEIALEG